MMFVTYSVLHQLGHKMLCDHHITSFTILSQTKFMWFSDICVCKSKIECD
jgi:hypothetical protein